ncbi:nuclear pore complex protein Nup133 isoform X2 [Oratosquilla oratoria]|uniref:nuclear pore complex protein Nup133 isoform X2 n=1 Tax=Oratosquilla oratoria TaxID=337810 RepID=UPI003F76A45C
MYTPKSATGSLSFSSASARAAAAKRRSGNIFTPGAKRSPFPQGRTTPLNRSFQGSQLIEGSGQYHMESYGSSLPALVMEVLAYADRNTEMSAQLDPSGWAWLVCGRRLLIWRYRPEGEKRLANTQFRELTLPPSDLAHRAQLVTVYASSENQVPSCIAVSPEGFVRYWPSIAHEGSYHEVSTELQGQECDSVLFLGCSLGCFLATTTSTTLLIQPGSSGLGGQQSVHVRLLKVPAGWLGGMSKRVSSLVFGSMPTQAPEARFVRAVGIPGAKSGEHWILVLSAHFLQKWHVEVGESDKLLYQCNVEKYIREGFVDHVWGRERATAPQLRVWLVDMQPTAISSVMILTAAVNPQVSQQLVYALVTLDTSTDAPPTGVSNFSVLKHSEYYQESAESVLLSQRFLLCKNTAYIYNKTTVLCVSANGEGDSGDRVEFSGAGDSIFGVGRSKGYPLFFSANNGIVSISPAHQLNQSSMMLNESIAEDQPSRISEALSMSIASVGQEQIGSSEDKVTRLQTAFLHYNRKNMTQAQSILDDLLDNTTLDRTVLQLSANLLDDTPANDPRWAENLQEAKVEATAPLLIANFLSDKTTAYQYYLKFLKETGLWPRLSLVTVGDSHATWTKALVLEHGEKLAMISALHTHHQEYRQLVDMAIRHSLADSGETPSGSLTHSDLFYRKVTNVEMIVWGLLKAQEDILSADVAPRDAPSSIYSVNALLLILLHAASEAKTHEAVGTSATDPPAEYVPWTASTGPRGLRTLIVEQHSTTVKVGVARAEDGSTRGKLYGQLVELSDIVLTGYQPHLQSLAVLDVDWHQKLLQDYERDRYNLIQPLVADGQYDQAVGLAEKYCDFRTLVEVCDKTDNQDRLNRYMNQFGSEGFPDFVFRWYLETGKRGKLLSHSGGRAGELARFLQDYTSLSWLHHLQQRDFTKAHGTLKQLAYEESNYLSRKKTLLSLSKLCGLASGAIGDELETEMSQEEDLILFQEQLPESVLSAHSLDADTMRVLTPTQLIHMYTGEENLYANEFDFKKALDLLAYVPSLEEAQQLKKDIWVRAVRRNSWSDLDVDNPIDAISDTLLFKTIELAFTQGSDIQELLLPVNEFLECDELSDLTDDSSFKFLVMAGYEKLQQYVG